ncbi:MAG TPA: glycoside hydrolase family 15 protein [Solirubrobacterales bacterium]|nr:glycoside hydrolase family 15 protein [Solirubrobacterales bacterium]
MREPHRIDGYAPIADYGVIGNERTAALVALDGSIDFLCLPRFDSEGVFAALLDPERGGSFTLRPTVPFEASHRYLPGTNVLETTFRTAEGEARVVDALSIPLTGPPKWQELIRKIEWVGGRVPMRWHVDPRFGWGERESEVVTRAGAMAVRDADTALVARPWDAGEPAPAGRGVGADFEVGEGSAPLIALAIHEDQPWLLSERHAIESRLEETCEYWRRWLEGGCYEGPWEQEVERSALALGMLLHTPSGAMMAAATTSLPEAIGGDRNFDYRYCWLRDTAFSLEAIQRFGRIDQVHATLTWLLRVIEKTNPNLKPFYGIEGAPGTPEQALPLRGYRDTGPPVAGNDADDQLQFGSYGDLIQSAEMFVRGGHSLGRAAAARLATALDFLAVTWIQPDSSIWELPERRDYTQGKLSAWLAFDSAMRLRDAGELDPDRRQLDAWRTARRDLADYVDDRCWSDERRSYLDAAGGEGLDAGTLLLARTGFLAGREERLRSTVDAIDRELGAGGPLLYRYTGMEAEEGAFVACSFWMVEALARLGERDRASERMAAMVRYANELGLYSEEIDAASGEFLGNLPQGLSHLSLINAAFALADE